ncbi:MAG: hypothetical protein AAF191_03495, partial [Verrucomicrobiota bacterium]
SVRWQDLACQLRLPSTFSTKVAAFLEGAYAEPHRAYHNLKHLEDLFEALPSAESTPELEMAIWFHDVIYAPRRTDNELASRQVFRRLFQPRLPYPFIQRTADLIRATEHGAELTSSDPEVVLFIDLDLLILSAPEDRYRAYTDQIRREYAHVPQSDFQRGRLHLLTQFLMRPRIYQSPLGIPREQAARKNLEKERDDLSAAVKSA